MVAARLNIYCVLAMAGAGCRVYDSALVGESPRAVKSVKSVDAGVSANAQAADNDAAVEDEQETMKSSRLAACGNGQVDENERCDIAIARGRPGACPEVCSGRDGCFKQHLAGQRCGARCEEIEITETISDDGCCPSGATSDSDNDCSPSCGNGTLEAGETCDPIETCPTLESCTRTGLCKLARFSGSPENCSARCEVRAVEECLSGDECCPVGCDAKSDSDCPRSAPASSETKAASPEVPDAGPVMPPPDAGCSEACPSPNLDQPDPEPGICESVHAAGSCETCDCAYCSDQVLGCIAQDIWDQRAACSAVIDCAARNHCSGTDCYCGSLDLPTCQRWPAGPCVREIRTLTGFSDAFQLALLAMNPQSSLGRAVSLLACRDQYCSDACAP